MPCLYASCILPVLTYGCETWTVVKTLAKQLDASDTWSLCEILWIPYTRHVTNATVMLPLALQFLLL